MNADRNIPHFLFNTQHMKKLISKKHFHFTNDYNNIFISSELNYSLQNKSIPDNIMCCGYKIRKQSNLQISLSFKEKTIYLPGRKSFYSKGGFDSDELEYMQKNNCLKKVIFIVRFMLTQLK